MEKVNVWIEKTVIPTYEIGEAEKNPMFLEKRVYQGSSGRVYPYPTIEKISDTKTDKEYTAVYLENEYLKIMVLPELGGRIQRAYDKTNDYDFVYYNHVIKPALVGLTGPWISGGIEFNWPQHHRPTTYLPVDFEIQKEEDGSGSVLCHDVDQMYGTKCITKLTLYPGKAFIEVTGQLYNRTALPQTFLWWANPAVAANDNTQSIFPPDVHAVMDHGKRDVSRFPVATGIYYKKDYSEGVDISRYKNIPVPTSYMAEQSKYDFVGGYDYGKEAGILHVADHHISPGKKQWTWGCGDFGRAWDRNLTDEDGPYIELMTGVYTDNQPDFTWLKPFEEKIVKQYFMPYKAVGQVKNATRDAAVHLSYDGEKVQVAVYATERFPHAKIVLTAGSDTVLEETVGLSPTEIYRKSVPLAGTKEEELWLTVRAEGRCLVEYRPEPYELPSVPEPAKAAEAPEEVRTCEELYLTGQHIEQYRHATYRPDPYYLEGLKRDPGDIRLNNAYGKLLMRRGQFADAKLYFRRAIGRLTGRNPNPYNSESYYLLGLSLLEQALSEQTEFGQTRFEQTLLRQRREGEAYDAFYKATWSSEQQEMSFYYLAAIAAKRGDFTEALSHIERALVKNMHNVKARGLKAYILRKLGRIQQALRFVEESLVLDPFDFVSGNERVLASGSREHRDELKRRMRGFHENFLMTARDYADAGAYEEAIGILEECPGEYPMLWYYKAYYASFIKEQGEKNAAERSRDYLQRAEACLPDYCFPNKTEDIAVLQYAIANGCKARAAYYLGCLFYDKDRWEEAAALWEKAAQADGSFPTVYRNLSIARYNKMGDKEGAKEAMEKAFSLNTEDERVFLELDQLYKKLGWTFEQRLKNYERHSGLIRRRDDLYIEYITLVNLCGKHEEALAYLMGHHFHPWEGGEGRVTAQYTLALLELAKKALREGCCEDAQELLHQALNYPENLGEGKLEGTKDNHIYYYLGLACKAQGRKEEAEECFTRASVGTDEPAGAMYYNDQPADMILYQGLSLLELGRRKEARARFYRLIDYGERHQNDEVKIDYFAVSLPDFLIFDEDYTKKNRAHCYYLRALGNIGLGETEKARELLQQVELIEPCHMMCRLYLQNIDSKFC